MAHFGLANAKIQFGIRSFWPKWSFWPFWTILVQCTFRQYRGHSLKLTVVPLCPSPLNAALLVVRTLVSRGRTVPAKGLFKENAPFIFFVSMGSFARTLFSRTLLPWPVLRYSGQFLHAKALEHLVWSNTSGIQFWEPLARTDFLSALYGLTIVASMNAQDCRVAYRPRPCVRTPHILPIRCEPEQSKALGSSTQRTLPY